MEDEQPLVMGASWFCCQAVTSLLLSFYIKPNSNVVGTTGITTVIYPKGTSLERNVKHSGE